MREKVLKILDKYVEAGDIVICGVSGGPDSTALLNVLADAGKYKIIVAHVNHGIRGREASRDEKFVKNLAKKYGLKFEIKRAELKGKSDLENLGRILRRDFFEKLCKKYKAKWILTAHTEDDQIETIIFNFLRGSGPAGLAGMKITRKPYLKPLLEVSKKEILAYLSERKIKFCIDSTNAHTKFSRNFIRKKIIPLLAQINPSFKQTILRNSIIFREIDEIIKSQAQDFLKKYQQTASHSNKLFPLKDFEKLPQALKRAAIQEAFRMQNHTPYRLSAVKIDEILRLFSRRIGNKRIICSGGVIFCLRRGFAEFDIS